MTLHAFLYDADGRDRQVQLDEDTLASLQEHRLLWIDIEARDPAALTRLAAQLEVDPACFEANLENEPQLDNYGSYFRFNVDAAPQHGALAPDVNHTDLSEVGSSPRIDFIVSRNWLVTIHSGPVRCLERFREQDKAETQIGLLSPQSLAASLLDWHLGSFFQEVSLIDAMIDKLDEKVLREPASSGLLGRMVAMRRRVSRLRTLLVRQRDIFYGLSRPDFALITDAGATPFYQALANRFERALDEVERARDLVTGSFELFTSRSSQQTNDLVKVLTFLTAIIGFCAAVAGLLGMNFQLPIFETGYRGFISVTAALVTISSLAVLYARRRDWI